MIFKIYGVISVLVFAHNPVKIGERVQSSYGTPIWTYGVTASRDSLRNYWSNPCGLKSLYVHHSVLSPNSNQKNVYKTKGAVRFRNAAEAFGVTVALKKDLVCGCGGTGNTQET